MRTICRDAAGAGHGAGALRPLRDPAGATEERFGMDKPSQADRRKYPRVRAEALVVVRRVEGEMRLGRGLDLGIGGIRFQCLGPDLEIGEVIEVTLALAEDSVTAVGTTIRVTDVGQMQEVAMAFEQVTKPEALERLCELGIEEDEEEPQA